MLKDYEATVIRHEVFGPVSACSETLRALRHELKGVDWPVTWIEGGTTSSPVVFGMHIFAVAGTHVNTICQEGEPVGRIFSDGHVRHCLLGNVMPSNLSASKPAQSRETFENIERALSEAGMGMANVVRTWFFLDNILSWYKPFNTVRTEFYTQRKVFNGLVPASTGVGGRNRAGAAVLAGAWAVQGLEGSVAAYAVPSPLQCPSMEYGSAFSRAVELTSGDYRRLLVSGTASIGLDGHSAHSGNLHKQIAMSMKSVHAILALHGFDFRDVTRATAYFKNIQDAPAFEGWRKEQRRDAFPLIVTQSTVCRDELLFEIELDATLSQKHSAAKPQPK
jgi:enamine deaminase RidA (YjgF/YER057c/UK114 family)